MADLFWFSDEQWSGIEPLLPSNTRGMPQVDDRRVLSGIVHVLKSGCHWADYSLLPRFRLVIASHGHPKLGEIPAARSSAPTAELSLDDPLCGSK